MAMTTIPQLQVINYLLTTKDSSLIMLNNLTDEYFSKEYKDAFNFIKKHLETYGKIPDVETFFSMYKVERLNVSETPDYLIKALFDDYNTRKIVDVVNDIKPKLLDGKVDEAVEQIKETMENMKEGVSLHCVDLLRDTSRYDAYVERLNNFGKYYLSTGFPELDQIVGGFDKEEELATIVARTNYGKSWILLKMTTAALKQGLNVGIYSGEMSERKVGYRVDTLIGHISNGGLTHGNATIQNDYKKYIESLPEMFPNSTLKVLTPKMINGPADVNALRMFIEKEHLDVLYIDQLSLLEDARHGRTDTEQAANISKDLKNLQVMKKIPIIAVSQQNRTGTEKENGVDTTQIARSDRIGQDATMVLFIVKEGDIMKLILKKSRDSENDKVLTYHIDLNLGNFVYVPDAKDGIGGKFEPNEDKFEEVPAFKDFVQEEDCF